MYSTISIKMSSLRARNVVRVRFSFPPRLLTFRIRPDPIRLVTPSHAHTRVSPSRLERRSSPPRYHLRIAIDPCHPFQSQHVQLLPTHAPSRESHPRRPKGRIPWQAAFPSAYAVSPCNEDSNLSMNLQASQCHLPPSTDSLWA